MILKDWKKRSLEMIQMLSELYIAKKNCIEKKDVLVFGSWVTQKCFKSLDVLNLCLIFNAI